MYINTDNDLKGPVRHFTISSSPTEDFIIGIIEKHEKRLGC